MQPCSKIGLETCVVFLLANSSNDKLDVAGKLTQFESEFCSKTFVSIKFQPLHLGVMAFPADHAFLKGVLLRILNLSPSQLRAVIKVCLG